MCFGSRPKSPPPPPKPEFKDAPPTVTGKQEDVENPFDTKKITDQLKLRRKKKESGKNLIQNIKIDLNKTLGSGYEIRRVENVGPKVSKELLKGGLIAIAAA